MSEDPFEALGLPARPDLADEEVRAAWRAIAAATHPDRPDGGDLARYTRASAAYAELRVPWGRSEAYADLTGQTERSGTGRDRQADREADETDTAPLPAVPGAGGAPGAAGRGRAGGPLTGLIRLPARIRRGRPLRLLIRVALTAAASLAVLVLIGGQPAARADVGGLILWLALAGRRDLAPPPEH